MILSAPEMRICGACGADSGNASKGLLCPDYPSSKGQCPKGARLQTMDVRTRTLDRCTIFRPTRGTYFYIRTICPTSKIPMEVGFMCRVRTILLSLLFVTSVCIPPSAHATSRETRPRLASPQEGEAIVQAAWQLRHGLSAKPDCSHFVHAIYTQAGFLYRYAASRAVFAGIESFRRVTKPQS